MKTLKLVGLQTFISPFTKLKPIRNGETVTVEDELAEHLLQGHENTRDRGRVDHWIVIPDLSATQDTEVVAESKANAPSETEDSGTDSKPDTPHPADVTVAPAPAPVAHKAVVKSQRVARKPASK